MCIRDSVWIVVPAYNEELIIRETLQEIRAAGYENIMVVDDGSQDTTYEAARTIPCLLYTSDAADERSSVDLGGRRIIKKKTNKDNTRKCDKRLKKVIHNYGESRQNYK